MTDTPIEATAGAALAPAPATPVEGLRVVAAVDGSEATGRVVNALLDLHERQPLRVIVLNTQPAPQEWRMRGYGWFHREEVHDRLLNDRGRRVLASVARHLDAAGIPHDDRVELGDPVETLSRCAREEACALIVFAEPPPGPIRRWLLRATRVIFGSAASVLVHQAPVGVLIVR